MANSPKPLNPTRLTLNKRHRQNDSPKTPIRIPHSSNYFDSSSPLHNDNNGSPCSTPITRKRSHFIEESPSQDYENYILLPSQDMQTNILDVGWKWDDSPKTNRSSLLNINSKSKKTLLSSNKRNNKNIVKNKNKIEFKTNLLNESEENNHGFYKFRQELLKIKTLENCNEDIIELDSSLKENTNSIIEKNIQNKLEINNEIKTTTMSIMDITTKTTTTTTMADVSKCKIKNEPISIDNDSKYNNLFDDSDTDNLLIELSQTVESEIKSASNKNDDQNKNNNKVTSCFSNNKCSLFKDNIHDNDSFDDILISLPIDDNELKKLKENPINNSNSKETASFKVAFGRFKTMPPSSIDNNCISMNHQKPKSSFTRHNSMPSENKTNSEPSSSKSILNRESSSRPKIISSSLEEIEKRRQEAKQRLMMTMQKKLKQQQQQKTK